MSANANAMSYNIAKANNAMPNMNVQNSMAAVSMNNAKKNTGSILPSFLTDLFESKPNNQVAGKRKASRKANRKAARKVSRKVSRKAARKVSRKANRKANRKNTRKTTRKNGRK